jgi:hypothetical protein
VQARTLNLPDALKLSITLGKYVRELPNLDGNVSDFLDSLFDKFSPEDFKEIIELLSGEKLKSDVNGTVLLRVFYEGLEKNKLLKLLSTSKEIGFI